MKNMKLSINEKGKPPTVENEDFDGIVYFGDGVKISWISTDMDIFRIVTDSPVDVTFKSECVVWILAKKGSR